MFEFNLSSAGPNITALSVTAFEFFSYIGGKFGGNMQMLCRSYSCV